MSIEIKLQLSEHSARILRSWSSVANTIGNVVATLDFLVANLDNLSNWREFEDLKIQLSQARDDLEYLKPPVSELCYQVKQALIEKRILALWDSEEEQWPTSAIKSRRKWKRT